MNHLVAALLASTSFAAFAGDLELHVLGPAASIHFDDRAALRDEYGNAKPFRERNPAFGLQVAQRKGGVVDRAFVSGVRDSYGAPSTMAGVGRSWELASFAGFRVDAGAVAGLWNRTVLTTKRDTQRVTMPFVLPTATLEHERSGLGLNVGFAPRIVFRGEVLNATNTAMLQLSLRV